MALWQTAEDAVHAAFVVAERSCGAVPGIVADVPHGVVVVSLVAYYAVEVFVLPQLAAAAEKPVDGGGGVAFQSRDC